MFRQVVGHLQWKHFLKLHFRMGIAFHDVAKQNDHGAAVAYRVARHKDQIRDGIGAYQHIVDHGPHLGYVRFLLKVLKYFKPVGIRLPFDDS